MSDFTLSSLEAIVAARAKASPDESWTAKLVAAGQPKAAKKLGEEAVETVIAAIENDRASLVSESADLLYHLMVVLRIGGVGLADVMQELERRTGQSGIAEKAGRYPAELSGGQQQRVAIARALAMRPKLIMFDEPTSALDPEMINEVLDVMTDLAHDGMTMLVVTHEMGFARSAAHRVVFMDQGRVVEQAPPDQFFTSASSPRARQFLSKVLHH